MKRQILSFIIFLLSFNCVTAQISYEFRNTPLTEALRIIEQSQSEYSISLLSYGLSDLRTSVKLNGLSVPDAVKRVCKDLPVKVKTRGKEITVQYKEKDDSRELMGIYGYIYDSRTHNELPGATVQLLSKDSTVIDQREARSYWRNGDREGYSAYFAFTVPKALKSYLLRVSYVGYETTYFPLTLNNLHKREYRRQLPPLYLKQQRNILKEVTVTASKVMFYYRGDTLVYNADAFQLAEGSMLDALIRQLPGVELKSDGRIYHNGKFVQSLLLNGKDFFRGDNRVMLDNLPSYTVKQIEVYDKYGEKSEFLGYKSENDKAYVMDVRLKKEYSIGMMANVEAGAGTNDRLLARLFAMRFTDHSRLTAFANANNLNDNQRPGENNSFNPGSQPGLLTQQQGGIDYDVDARNKKWRAQGNVQALRKTQDLQTTTSREYFLTGGNTFEESHRRANDKTVSLNTWHQFRYNFERMQLTLSPQFSYTHTDNRSLYTSSALTANDSILYANRQQGLLRGHELRTAFTAKSVIKLPNTNDHIELETNMNLHDRSHDRFNRQHAQYAAMPSQPTDQYFKSHPDRYKNIWANAMYARILRNNMQLETSLSYEHRDTRKEESLYLLDRLDRHDSIGVLPSVAEYERTMDAANSYSSHLYEDYYTLRPLLWWFPEMAGGRWSIGQWLNFRLLDRHLHYQRGTVDTLLHRRTLLFDTGNSYAQWKKKTENDVGHIVFFAYRLHSEAPNLHHFVNIHDTTDPLNIHEGNASLTNTYTQNVQLGYRRVSKRNNLYASADYHYMHNALAMSSLFDSKTGIKTHKPYNVNGNWDGGFVFIITTPIDRKKHLDITIGPKFRYTHSVDLTGTTTLQRSTVATTHFAPTAELTYKLASHTFRLNAEPTWQWLHSRRTDFENFHVSNSKTTLTALLALPWQLQLSTDISLYMRRGYVDESMNTDQWVWNARLSRPFLKGKLLVMLDGFDLLGQLDNVTRTVNAQGRTETYTNSLPRYALLHALYKFNKQPKKK